MKKKVIIITVLIIVLAIFIFYPDDTLDGKYNQVSIGDSYETVEKLINFPDEILPELPDGSKICIWVSRQNIYTWKYPFIKKKITDERSLQLVVKNNKVQKKIIVNHNK